MAMLRMIGGMVREMPGLWSDRGLRRASVMSASALGVIGLVMVAMALLTPMGAGRRAAESALGLGMVFAGALLGRAAFRKRHAPLDVDLLPGELALAVDIFYLGAAMPAFHSGPVSYQDATIQFIAFLGGLFAGSLALAISGATRVPRPAGRIAPGAAVRESVLFIVGTIVVAIALSQMPDSMVKPPMWSWISFLGITIPGMLIVVAREGAREMTENWGRGARGGALLPLLVTEPLLVIGLAVILYGSYTNLSLGRNGYAVGMRGNAVGAVVWIGAAIFLVVVRVVGALTYPLGREPAHFRFVSRLLYVVGAIAFIYGERSVVSGEAPTPTPKRCH